MWWRTLSVWAVAGTISISATAAGDTGARYPDGHGGEVFFPLGDISFADEVVVFDIGDPRPRSEGDADPVESLGIPDYDKAAEDFYVTLGCRGTLTLRFDDNVLTDIDGPDLYVFEIGPAVEATQLEISVDGATWIDVGRISGATAAVDISSAIDPGDAFSYVRLTDLAGSCNGNWPGADIDAVGAIGAGRRIVLDSSVLFDFDKAELKDEAREKLTELAIELGAEGEIRLVIEGHTDSVGAGAYNQKLSLLRATAVRDLLATKDALKDVGIRVSGYGESRPVASNDTEEGRAENRRVEILVVFDG